MYELSVSSPWGSKDISVFFREKSIEPRTILAKRPVLVNTEIKWWGILGLGFSAGSDGKESVCNVGDLGSISGLERSLGGGHGNPLQYSLHGESPWTEESDRLQSMGSQRVGHDSVTKHSTAHPWLIFARSGL